MDVGLLAGVGAKEIVASTMGVLYANDESLADDSEAGQGESRYEKPHTLMVGDVAQMHGLAPSDGRVEAVATLTAFCFLLFVLLYFPCLATIAAIKGETGSWKWALFAAAYTTLTAWVVSALVFRIGLLFI